MNSVVFITYILSFSILAKIKRTKIEHMLQTIGKYFKNLSEEFDSFETLIFSYFYLPCPENIQK